MFQDRDSGTFDDGDFSTLTTPDMGHYLALLRNEDARSQGAIETAGRCGCVRCHELFLPGEIEAYLDVDGLDEQVAVCPECGATMVVNMPARVQEPYAVLWALEKTFDTYGWDEESWS